MTVQVNGELIKELRIKHSYSQEKLAEIVGVNLRTIQRTETNGVAALSTRGALAKALGVKPEDLDARDAPAAAAPPGEPVGLWPRWSLLMLSAVLVVFGATALAISIQSVTPIGLVTLPAVGGLLVALIGFVILTRLTPLPRWRTYAVLCIVVVSMIVSPPAWTVRALVAISLWAAFELGILATRLRLRVRYS
jgi:transcriptional regulator with XRE-family HTH domain